MEKERKNYKKFTLCRFFYECENYARSENVESLSSKDVKMAYQLKIITLSQLET
jgi:hypothetical protein